MPRAPRITVCSNCLEDFVHNEMYTVGKPMMPGSDEVGYYTMFCKKCTKKATDSYIRIIEEPKPPKKRVRKSKKK